MEMEVVTSVPRFDFDFDSGRCSSTYMTAPSSPQRFGNFFSSAPTSPTRISSIYGIILTGEEENGEILKAVSAASNGDVDNNDFEFNFSGQLERVSLSADELFDGGKIRPLKQLQGKRITTPEALPPEDKKDFDPFEAKLEKQREVEFCYQRLKHEENRGRERFVRRGSRSLPRLRISDVLSDLEDDSPRSEPVSSTSTSSLRNSSISVFKGYRKWRIKDFLLFRSVSEGRATDREPLQKYAVMSKKKVGDDVRNSSFRSTESSNMGSSFRRRKGAVSAHELHYTMNRAVSEEMRKKTFLPYKQGLLGCLGFNHGMHEISRRFGSLTRV